jgi:hypothetical protein
MKNQFTQVYCASLCMTKHPQHGVYCLGPGPRRSLGPGPPLCGAEPLPGLGSGGFGPRLRLGPYPPPNPWPRRQTQVVSTSICTDRWKWRSKIEKKKHFLVVTILGQKIAKYNFYYLKKPFSFVTKGNKPIIRALLIVFAT